MVGMCSFLFQTLSISPSGDVALGCAGSSYYWQGMVGAVRLPHVGMGCFRWGQQ